MRQTEGLSGGSRSASAPSLLSGGSGAPNRRLGHARQAEHGWPDPGSPCQSDIGIELDSTISSPEAHRHHGDSRPGTGGSSSPMHGTSASMFSSRSGTGRFSSCELNSFKRVPMIFGELDPAKSDYWNTTGYFRRVAGTVGQHLLPVMKDAFFHPPSGKDPRQARSDAPSDEEHVLRAALGRRSTPSTHSSPSSRGGQPGKRRRPLHTCSAKELGQPLPEEKLTSAILDIIYPLKPIVKEKDRPPSDAGDDCSDDAVDAVDELFIRHQAVSFAQDLVGPGRQTRIGGLRIQTCDDEFSPGGTPSNAPRSQRNSFSGSVELPGVESVGGSPDTFKRASPKESKKGNLLTVPGRSRAPSNMSNSGSAPSLCQTAKSPESKPTSPMKRLKSPGNLVGTISSACDSEAGLTTQGAMLDFRSRLMQAYGTVGAAFAEFAKGNHGAELRKKDWKKLLAKHGFEWPNKEERDAVLSNLDFSKDRPVAIDEFHIAVEASTPIRTIEDLRRRWLAQGFTSMLQAIAIMDNNGQSTGRRLSLREFGEVLSRVYVFDSAEHVALFTIICSDTKHGRASVGELACAVAAVSPVLLLEDVRSRFMAKSSGGPDKWYNDIDKDRNGSVEWKEFLEQGTNMLNLTELETKKFFQELDAEGRGYFTDSEFVCALAVCEPSLLLEDLRLKVRQRWRSIEDQLEKAFIAVMNADPHSVPELTLQQFQDILRQCDMKDSEANILFKLIDSSRDGKITVAEVSQGIRKFAPSYALDRLRMGILYGYGGVVKAFETCVPSGEFNQALEFKAFELTLGELDLEDGFHTQRIFDLIDVKHDGIVTMGRLLASLQSGGPGSVPRLPPEERDAKAKQDMLSALSPIRRIADHLKGDVRRGQHIDDEQERQRREGNPAGEPMDLAGVAAMQAAKLEAERLAAIVATVAVRDPLQPPPSPIRWPLTDEARAVVKDLPNNIDEAVDVGKKGDQSHAAACSPLIRSMQHEQMQMGSMVTPIHPRAATRPSQMCYAGASNTFGAVWRRVHDSGHDEHGKINKDLQGYFQNVAWHMSHDVPLQMGTSQSYMDNHVSIQAHHEALLPSRMKSRHRK